MAHNERKWSFAVPAGPEMNVADMPSMGQLYEMSLNRRDEKRKTYQRALDAALENLVMWERAARADGFGVRTLTDIHGGSVHTVFHPEDGTVEFVQAYGVIVEDLREKK